MSENDEIEIVSFAAGDYLFHENEKSFHFYIIQEGQVEIFKTAKSGAKISLSVVEQGVSLGEFAMISQRPRSASARAVTDVRAAKINAKVYEQLLQELPEWAISVLRGLVERLRHTNDLIREKGIVDEAALSKLDALQYDSSSTLTGTSVNLLEDDDDEDPTFG